MSSNDFAPQVQRDPNWFVSKKKPWEIYPGPQNPDVRVVKGYDGKTREFRWWLQPCPEYVDPTDQCPGYLVEHVGPGGETIKLRECPYHGYRWSRPRMSLHEKNEDLRLRLNAALIPPAIRHFTFSTFPKQDSRVLPEVMAYARAGNLTQNLFLMGPFGTGKTGLAVSIIKERIEAHGERALFMVVPSLFAEIRATMGEDRTGSDLLQRVMNVHLLVLDDLGAERPTEWVREQLYNILNGRLMSERPTIITSNLSTAELGPWIGERTAERLKAYRILMVGGENLRNRKNLQLATTAEEA